MEMHQKSWKKISANCFEVRGKTLGIIGYGNIGTQVSTLAEAMGMNVLFFDVISKLPMGNAKGCNTLDEVLKKSDFITLHVPATTLTKNMIAAPQLAAMKKGSYLINASRGKVVDIEALAASLKSNHLAGAAIDVYPEEPESNGAFETVLQGIPNVILTPHIGGATEEAQSNIGEEVPTTLMRFINTGSTLRSVNFPNVDIAPTANQRHRILNVHRNVPGVLSKINRLVSEIGANIEAQNLATDAEIGYLILETNKALSLEIKHAIDGMSESIKTRILY
jgi:D-3-phosphoglycerate dehydrogenase